MKLLENQAKSYLHTAGLPVPKGQVAHDAEQASDAAENLAGSGGKVAVKGLVAAGRRGKAGAVRMVSGGDAAQQAAIEILNTEVAGQHVNAIYVESAVDVSHELYLSFTFGSTTPQLVLSYEGGVEIEQVATENPEALVCRDINPLRGIRVWDAVAYWEQAGAPAAEIVALAHMTVDLYEAFVSADGLMLEINPLVVQRDGSLVIVGSMLEIDNNATFRHREWLEDGANEPVLGGRAPNERERAVLEANRALPGASVRYTELDGDIGLMVSGGGAGLLQHDMLLELGGSPSCHTDLSPSPTAEKPAAVIEAILRNPRTEGLLMGFNYLQLAPCDKNVEALLLALERCNIDTANFPVVLRLFGPSEDRARCLLANRPGITYLPRGATLKDGVRAIIDAVANKPVRRFNAHAEGHP